MAVFEEDLIFIIRQFLNEEKYKETLHKLEQESSVFFNMGYFENEVKQGNWDEVEKYLLGFTKLDANRHSIKMFFEIRKQKYLEAIDKHDDGKAADILMKDLKVFKARDEELYKKMTQLLTLENFRQNELLSSHGDTNSARVNLFLLLKALILANPLLKDKLQLPSLERSRLHTLITQSLNWQHSLSLNLTSINSSVEAGGVSLCSEPKTVEKPNILKLTEISNPTDCRSLRLPHHLRSSKISRLTYTNLGSSILALASNATLLLWKWPQNEHNLTGKVTASICPQLWKPRRCNRMTNDTTDINPELHTACLAVSNNGHYVISASGGDISLFNTNTFAIMSKFMTPPPAATFLIFYPENNNILIIGMEDSTIKIYYSPHYKYIEILAGHHTKRITGLAFSQKLNVLVSSDANAQLCVWKWDTWEKQNSTYLIIPAVRRPVADTRLKFLKDQIHFLVVHQSQLAVYETRRLERVNQWMPQGFSALITDATLSCDSELVFASFRDATICVFSAANLQPQCRINPSAYLPANVSCTVFPIAIAVHPIKPNQFALGLTDGGVHVIEPLESNEKWPGCGPMDHRGVHGDGVQNR